MTGGIFFQKESSVNSKKRQTEQAVKFFRETAPFEDEKDLTTVSTKQCAGDDKNPSNIAVNRDELLVSLSFAEPFYLNAN